MDAAADGRRDERWSGVRVVVALLALMWIVEIVDFVVGGDLDRHGIEPRDADGLIGIVAAPFLHAGAGHLLANTIPFAILGTLIALAGAARVLGVAAISALVSGLGTWLVAPGGTLHVGASGVVFGFATYLVTRGFFDRRIVSFALGAAVVLIWGGALLGGILLPGRGVSWQGHLFGAIGGVLAARHVGRRRR